MQDSSGDTASSFRSDGHTQGDDDGELPYAYRLTPTTTGGCATSMTSLFSPRLAVSFDVTPNQVLLAGSSAAFGPNSRGGPDSGNTRTEIYGIDLTWKWKSPRHHGGFPFVQWQTEGMWRRYEAGALTGRANRIR